MNNFLSRSIFPIFGSQVLGEPAVLDYSRPDFIYVNPRNQNEIENYTFALMKNADKSWAMGGYLENRSHLLNGTHIKSEGRIYHLGIDAVLPAGTHLYSPFPGTVYEKGYEAGDGNYGGFVIMEYEFQGSIFYALYGHLSYPSIIQKTQVEIGEHFADLGARQENGNWFDHLHLQIFTGRDLHVWKSRGYCSFADLATIKNYCPDPTFLLHKI